MKRYLNQSVAAGTLFTGLLSLVLSNSAISQPQIELETPDQAQGDIGFTRHRDEMVVIGQEAILRAGDSARNMVVVAGSATIEGEVDRDVIIVGGAAQIDGTIGHDLVIVGGTATFGEGAEIGGSTILIGGPFDIHDAAVLRGEHFELPLTWLYPFFTGMKDWLANSLLLARPFAPSISWTWWFAGALFIINLVILVLLSKPVSLSVSALVEKPVTTFLVGLLGFVLFWPLQIILAATGIGVLLIPFMLCALVAAMLIGKVVVYTATGQQLGSQLGTNFLQAPLPAFVIGSLAFLVVYLVPVLGFLVLGIVLPLGFGAVVIAVSGLLKVEFDKRSSNGKSTVAVKTKPPESGASTGESTPEAVSGDEADSEESAESDKTIQSADSITMTRVGFWPRLGAVILDLILISVVVSLFDFGGDAMPRFFIIVWFAYHVVMWTLKGTTLGGMILRLKCVRIDGSTLDWGVSVTRSLASFFSFVVLCLGFFWASWNKDKQAWHDIIAGTTIVQVPKGTAMV